MSYEYNTAQVIAALYENEDPVSIDGAAHMQELVNHINELQSRLESLEKDAARYRYLTMGFGIYCITSAMENTSGVLKGDGADFAIDAAMQANKGE